MMQILEDMRKDGIVANETTHELLVEAAIIRHDADGVISALATMQGAGFEPHPKLLDKVSALFSLELNCAGNVGHGREGWGLNP